MSIKAFLFLSLLILFQPLRAQEINLEQTITSLERKGRIDFTLIPTIHAYERICKNNLSHNEKIENIENLCNIVVKSDFCQRVKNKDLLKCNSIHGERQLNIWEFIKGCAQGVLDSVKDFLHFMWSILKWIWNQASSHEARTQTFDQASEYINVIKLYLHTEFEKNYAKAQPPFKMLKTLTMMKESVSVLLLNFVVEMIAQNYAEFGCLNFQAKSGIMCKFIGDIFIPPAAVVGLIKHGPKAIKIFPNLKKAFTELPQGFQRRGPFLAKAKEKDLQFRVINKGEPIQTGFSDSLSPKGKNEMVRMPAHYYEVSFKLDEAKKRKRLYLAIPAQKSGKANMKLFNKIKVVISELPERALRDLDDISIEPYRSRWDDQWAKDYDIKNFRSEAVAGFSDAKKTSTMISIFPAGIKFRLKSSVLTTMNHELGHIVAAKKYGSTKPDQKWVDAARHDGRKVSDYGEVSYDEDFAEAMALYIKTDGGVKNPKILEKLSHRFKILDEIMKMDTQARKQIADEFKLKMARRKIFWTTASGTSLGGLTSFFAGDQGVIFDEPQ